MPVNHTVCALKRLKITVNNTEHLCARLNWLLVGFQVHIKSLHIIIIIIIINK